MRINPEIIAHYEQGVERRRLATVGRLEAARSRELLERYLPSEPAVVLDVGGAEGAYALPLAAAGYTVHLLDPVERHVDAARAASAAQPEVPLVSAVVGDARALPYADADAHAVLLWGPLYHLIESEDRAATLAEAYRVLRSGGVLLAVGISRFASTLDGLRHGVIHDPRFETMVEGDLRDGIHRNPDIAGHPEWFTLAYFHTPDSLRDEIAEAGFDAVRVLAVEGIAATVDVDDALDDPARRATMLRAIRRVETDPSILGVSPHLMGVATKP